MIELVAVLLVLYGLSVLASWGMIKLIFDDIPPKYALIPVLNMLMPLLDLDRGRTARQTSQPVKRTPEEELDREWGRHHWTPPGL